MQTRRPPAGSVSHLREAGARQIRTVDPRMAAVIRQVGPCRLVQRRGHFAALARAIVGQQVSGAAARAIFERTCAVLDSPRPTAQAVLAATDAQLRGAGLSRQKVSYLRDLAEKVQTKQVRFRGLHRLDDDGVIEHLTQVKGIGRWTAEMFLMFVLSRPDVLPVDDLGIQKGFQHVYGFRTLPGPDRMRKLAAPWRPYRTVGSWYLWRSIDGPAN